MWMLIRMQFRMCSIVLLHSIVTVSIVLLLYCSIVFHSITEFHQCNCVEVVLQNCTIATVLLLKSFHIRRSLFLITGGHYILQKLGGHYSMFHRPPIKIFLLNSQKCVPLIFVTKQRYIMQCHYMLRDFSCKLSCSNYQ